MLDSAVGRAVFNFNMGYIESNVNRNLSMPVTEKIIKYLCAADEKVNKPIE